MTRLLNQLINVYGSLPWSSFQRNDDQVCVWSDGRIILFTNLDSQDVFRFCLFIFIYDDVQTFKFSPRPSENCSLISTTSQLTSFQSRTKISSIKRQLISLRQTLLRHCSWIFQEHLGKTLFNTHWKKSFSFFYFRVWLTKKNFSFFFFLWRKKTLFSFTHALFLCDSSSGRWSLSLVWNSFSQFYFNLRTMYLKRTVYFRYQLISFTNLIRYFQTFSTGKISFTNISRCFMALS